MQRIRPAFQVLVPASIFVWSFMALTILFGPDEWYSAATLHYVDRIPDGVWGTVCGVIACGLAFGAMGGSWLILRISFALALFVASCRFLLLAMAIPEGLADNVATIPAWAFLAVTHAVIAREPFTTAS